MEYKKLSKVIAITTLTVALSVLSAFQKEKNRKEQDHKDE